MKEILTNLLKKEEEILFEMQVYKDDPSDTAGPRSKVSRFLSQLTTNEVVILEAIMHLGKDFYLKRCEKPGKNINLVLREYIQRCNAQLNRSDLKSMGINQMVVRRQVVYDYLKTGFDVVHLIIA